MYVQVQISTVTYCARFSKQPPKSSAKECNGIAAAALTMAEEEDVWCALLYHDDGRGATEKGGIGPASRRRRSKGFRTRNNNSNNNLALLHKLKVHCIEYCTTGWQGGRAELSCTGKQTSPATSSSSSRDQGREQRRW